MLVALLTVITLNEVPDRVTVVRVEGGLFFANADAVRARIKRAATRRRRRRARRRDDALRAAGILAAVRAWLVAHQRKVVAWVPLIFGLLLIISALAALL